MLLPPQDFDSEAYHELLLFCDLPGAIYSEEYDAAFSRLEEQIKTLQNRLGAARQRELRAEADEKLADGRRELDEAREEVRAERAKGLYQDDLNLPVRKSHENPDIKAIYAEYFGEPNSHKAHEVLHTAYTVRKKY